jgi:hypothetical protein
MKPSAHQTSIPAVRLDLAVAKILVWVASVGRDAELTPEAHLYFFERYQRLSDYHRRRGHAARARRLQLKADEHYQLSGEEGPPFAAAMGMPRPRRWVATDAVSRYPSGPDAAA